ncbi:MAG: hypothetical protein ACPKPY_04340 [Nitrososphaeraceae archaeon]
MILNYISLVTKENIETILSKIEDIQQQKDFLNLMLKIDVRISTEPVIVGDKFYYKIWIIKRSTRNKAHLKWYYPIAEIKEKSKSIFNLSEILESIRLVADVPNDFEEYCEIHLLEPSDPVCRNDYLYDLDRAERFKKFMTQNEIRSIPFCVDKDYHDSKDNIINMENEDVLRSMGYSIISLKDKKEYDILQDLVNSLEYYGTIIDSYGLENTKDEFNEQLFFTVQDDNHLKNIIKDIKTYNKIVIEYKDYLKYLIKKYNIYPSGNLDKRIAFYLDNNKTIANKFIHVVIDYTFF